MIAKKRLLPILVAVLMVFAMMPMSAGTVYAEEAGWVDIGELNYYIDPGSGEAAVCGRAEDHAETELTIPANIEYEGQTYNVTLIAGYAFENDQTLEKVTVTAGIKEIGFSAFKSCSNLVEIDLPDGLDSVGEEAFENTALYNDSSNWKEDVLYIGNYLIKAKENISGTCSVKEGTRLIASYAFSECHDLEGVTIPASVVKISGSAFQDCTSLSQVTFAEDSQLTWIGASAFAHDSKLTSITIPQTVTTIESDTFLGTGLSSIVLPEGLKEIGVSLFDGCSGLQEVTIPSTVTAIQDFAFYNCDALTTIHFGGSPSQWAAITGNGKPDITPTDYGIEEITTMDIGNVWTELSPTNGIAYTTAFDPDGLLDSKMEFVDQFWTDTETQEEIHIGDSTLPIIGHTYAFSVIIAPKAGYAFNDGKFDEFIYGGNPVPEDSYRKVLLESGNILLQWGVTATSKPDDLSNDKLETTISGITSKTYTGKAQSQSVTVKIKVQGEWKTLKQGTDYELTYKNNVNAGTATVTVNGLGYFTGKVDKTFTINKAANPLKISAKTATVKYSKLKKKAQTLAVTKVIKFTKQLKDKKTYTLVSAKKGSKSFKKYFKINKTTGKVTVKKGLKKGTYKVKVKVKAAGNANYKASAVKTVTFKIKVN